MQVESDYIFDDLNPDDIVLDIGAGIGAFSLKVHRKVNHVYAVEPLWTNELLKNCGLSNANNVTVLPYALSKEALSVEYEDRKANVEGKTLSEFKKLCGGHVDFLKMDCEGGEWNIKPYELEGIRRIEAEIHSFNGENLNDFVEMLESCGFIVKKKKNACNNMLIHAWKM
ncbi:FkbM family methyltransferase [Methanohalobium sp.]|uniref:FkbM family methyltransferase n=1 Tax=Methanohalobium sp. TaxID=2837493 RepID=UPI00397CE145